MSTSEIDEYGPLKEFNNQSRSWENPGWTRNAAPCAKGGMRVGSSVSLRRPHSELCPEKVNLAVPEGFAPGIGKGQGKLLMVVSLEARRTPMMFKSYR